MKYDYIINIVSIIVKVFPAFNSFKIQNVRKNSNILNFYCKKAFQNAFTLAEVLITLGIIGVVAAMTIPTLNSKINEIAPLTR